MNILNKIKSLFRATTLEDMLRRWDDNECLENFMKFFGRVTIGSEFEQTGKIVTHEVLVIQCGEATATSPPLQLGWPMRPVSAKLQSSMVN